MQSTQSTRDNQFILGIQVATNCCWDFFHHTGLRLYFRLQVKYHVTSPVLSRLGTSKAHKTYELIQSGDWGYKQPLLPFYVCLFFLVERWGLWICYPILCSPLLQGQRKAMGGKAQKRKNPEDVGHLFAETEFVTEPLTYIDRKSVHTMRVWHAYNNTNAEHKLTMQWHNY